MEQQIASPTAITIFTISPPDSSPSETVHYRTYNPPSDISRSFRTVHRKLNMAPEKTKSNMIATTTFATALITSLLRPLNVTATPSILGIIDGPKNFLTSHFAALKQSIFSVSSTVDARLQRLQMSVQTL
ncbi:hypothetical protein PS15p_211669 [Mucor circinelloides]